MRKAVAWIEKVQLMIGVAMLVIFFTAVIIQVSTRFLGISVIWTGDVARYSFIWAIFMGASVMIYRKEHFKFDFLYTKFKGRLRASLSLFNDTVIFLFSFALFYYGIDAVTNFWNYNWASLNFMKMGYVWIAVPVMGLTMMIYMAEHIVDDIKGLLKKEAKQ
ncbi:TRAP transporter small permease [Salisediminibacterium beveridgei]|uniref:TRAP-type C4-dicarboxylate transport system, small permease component n=1 Tax=Salisediminibacterium beveridgei TaxID=632773 RepID=A0A1D7QRL3_9BACI|nr:TRAP transporter small permease [Salisediminibacterium beveridgei]AOM81639.1 TRAP-type C4-dicarboxylate transport system, small permease component [Salisediminibacterium beveridgei]